MLRSCGRMDDAEQILRSALKLDAEHLHVIFALGDLVVQRGELSEAIELYRIATRSAPHNAATHSVLASSLVLLGTGEEAVAVLSAGLKVAKDTHTLWCAKARLLRKLRRTGEAVEAWKAALSEQPERLILKMEIASDFSTLGRHADALSAYQDVAGDERLASEHRHQAALAAGRLARDKLRDAPTAIGFFEQAAALNQDHMTGRQRVGRAIQGGKTLGACGGGLPQDLIRSPTDVSALTSLAALKRLSGEPQQALALIEAACMHNPQRSWSQLEFGYILRDLGRSEEATARFETIENDSPAQIHALMALAQIAWTQSDYRSAAKFFDDAAKRATNPIDALRKLATVRSAAGDLGSAEEAIERILAHNPAFTPASWKRGD